VIGLSGTVRVVGDQAGRLPQTRGGVGCAGAEQIWTDPLRAGPADERPRYPSSLPHLPVQKRRFIVVKI
jgi:hypothetical protein